MSDIRPRSWFSISPMFSVFRSILRFLFARTALHSDGGIRFARHYRPGLSRMPLVNKSFQASSNNTHTAQLARFATLKFRSTFENKFELE